jgi:peptidoglycan/xylan/chitin deacetylase (PgdA/CDA1 family)
MKSRNLKFLNKSITLQDCLNKNQFALTFDDGPNILTEKHLEFFERKNVTVTFFFIANRLEDPKMSEIVKKALKKGHQIGNHNYFHQNITQKLQNATEADVLQYMKKSTQIFYKKIGVAPKYFRPPFGEITNAICEMLRKFKFQIALWNLDTMDWYWEKEGRDKLKIVQVFIDELVNNKNPSSSYISLQHEKSKNLEAEFERLNYIIDLVRMKGFKIVPMWKCVNDDSPYFDKNELAIFDV